ncbi:hypothetical protein MRX96_052060 [Rhipicephalus microplus]
MCPVDATLGDFLLFLGSDAKDSLHNRSPRFSAVSMKKAYIRLDAFGTRCLAQVALTCNLKIRICLQLSALKILHSRLDVFSVGAILPSNEDKTGIDNPCDKA